MAQARQWTVHPDETGEVDKDALTEALYEASVFLRRGGGAVAMQAIRHRDGDGPEHFTSHVVVQWMARTDSVPRFDEPDVSQPPAEKPEAPVVEPEPVGVAVEV